MFPKLLPHLTALSVLQPILLLQKSTDPNQKGHLITSSNSPTNTILLSTDLLHTQITELSQNAGLKQPFFGEIANLLSLLQAVPTPPFPLAELFQTLILLAARKPRLISRLNLSSFQFAGSRDAFTRLKSPPPCRNKCFFLPGIITSLTPCAGIRKVTKAEAPGAEH